MAASDVFGGFSRPTFTPSQVPGESMPSMHRRQYDALAMQPTETELEQIKSDKKKFLTPSGSSKHFEPAAVQLMVNLGSGAVELESLTRVWQSLVPRRQDVIQRIVDGQAFMVYDTSRLGILAWPVELQKVGTSLRVMSLGEM